MSSKRRRVLPEEEYTANLAQVVQRQYFPDLPQLADTAALYERRAAGYVAGAVAIRRVMRQRQIAEEQELLEQQQNNDQGAPAIRPLHQESLTGFHARVTSEDNAAYTQQQAQDEAERRQQQRLEYGTWSSRLTNGKPHDPVAALPPSNTLIGSPLPLASDQFNATPHRKSMQEYAREAQEAPLQNALLFLPTAESEKAQNTLALPPSSTQSTYHSSMPPPSRQSQTQIISSLPSYQDREKRIEPAATRFPSANNNPATHTLGLYRPPAGLNLEESESESETTLDYASTTDASTDLDAPARFSLPMERRLGQRRKARELETMVQMTPLITPGSNDDEEPIMTWGEVAATPLVLSGATNTTETESTSTEPAFAVTVSAQDRAAEKARRRMEQRARLASATPQRRAAPQRPSSIFSARPASARSASSLGTALRSSYTPLSSTSRRPSHIDRRTPRVRSGAASGGV